MAPSKNARLRALSAAVVSVGLALALCVDVLAQGYGQSGYSQQRYSYNPPPSQYERCSSIAQQRSGYSGGSSHGPGALEGAAGGALAGSFIGGWSGNAGGGAAWGAAIGAVAGGIRKRNRKNEEESRRSEYDKAFEECMNYHQTPYGQSGGRRPPTAPARIMTPVPTLQPQVTPAPQPITPVPLQQITP